MFDRRKLFTLYYLLGYSSIIIIIVPVIVGVEFGSSFKSSREMNYNCRIKCLFLELKGEVLLVVVSIMNEDNRVVHTISHGARAYTTLRDFLYNCNEQVIDFKNLSLTTILLPKMSLNL